MNFLSIIGLDKYVGQIIVGLLITAIAGGGYLYWRSEIRSQALAEYNRTQLQSIVDSQNEQARINREIQQRQEAIISRMNEQISALQTRTSAATRYINSPQAAASNRLASEVVRNTIDQLRTREQR